MTFSNPLAFWLLLLLPLLLLARRREPVSRIPVGNLFLWKQSAAVESAIAPRQLRRDPLFLLQAAFVTAVVVALARPTLGSPSVSIVIDTSLSMGALDGTATRLDLGKEHVRRLIDSLPWRSRVRVIEAAAVPIRRLDFTAARASIVNAVDALTPTDAPADIDAAIRLAREDSPSGSRVYVVTDTTPGGPGDPLRDLEWITVGHAADNLAITHVSYRRAAQPGRIEVLAEVANFGRTDVTSDVIPERAGVTLPAVPFRAAAGARTSVLTEVPDVAGVVAVRVPHRDALSADNERRIVIDAAAPLRVQLSGDHFFLRQALAADPNVVLVDSAPRDVFVCVRCSDIPSTDAGLVIVGCGGAACEARGDGDLAEAEAAPAPLITTQSFFAHDIALDGIAVVSTASPTANGADRESAVVARAGGKPAILAYESGPHRVVQLRFDPDVSPIALTPVFPMLIASAAEWTAAGARDPATVEAGEAVTWTGDVRSGTAVVAHGRGGRRIDALATGDGRIAFARTLAAGTYTVDLGADRRELVVNPAANLASDLRTRRVADVGPGAGPDVRSDGTLASAPPLAIALALLALEWHYRRRRRHIAVA